MCEAIAKKFPGKQPELVTGGFHLRGISQHDVEQISDKLKSLGFSKVAPSHCTGEKSIEILKERWGEHFGSLNLGDSYVIR
jgi:7,8-dihydropterin-6-yl-methyl-4-(beta-D-ribofuranosyl)aminobenzene 5'-phosphate synthase